MTIQTLHRSLSALRPKTFVLLFLAGVINAIGVTLFLAPVQLYDSGISGTAMLFWQLTPEPYTLPMFLVLLNTPLFLFGMKKQGLTFTVYSLWAVLIYALASFAINTFFPTAGASPFAGDDLLLCAVFGGLISGVGSGHDHSLRRRHRRRGGHGGDLFQAPGHDGGLLCDGLQRAAVCDHRLHFPRWLCPSTPF